MINVTIHMSNDQKLACTDVKVWFWDEHNNVVVKTHDEKGQAIVNKDFVVWIDVEET